MRKRGHGHARALTKNERQEQGYSYEQFELAHRIDNIRPGQLWPKKNDLSVSGGRRAAGWLFEFSKPADHRIEGVEGLRNESRFPVLRDQKRFLFYSPE